MNSADGFSRVSAIGCLNAVIPAVRSAKRSEEALLHACKAIRIWLQSLSERLDVTANLSEDCFAGGLQFDSEA
jgi:hypothetical protein